MKEIQAQGCPNGFYYGWVIAGLSIVSLSFWFGFRTTFSIFFVALTDHFHWGRAETAGVQSLAMFVYTLMAPIVGGLVDRLGPRRVVLPGTVLMGVGLFFCTRIETLTQFYLFFGLIAGTGATCLSIVPFTVILAHWFEKKRGMANGLAGMGIGIGPLFFVPLLQYLINFRGWEFAFVIFCLLVFFIPLPLNAFLLRHRPQDMGLLPDGEIQIADQKAGTVENLHPLLAGDEERFREVIRTARFWALICFPCLAVFGVYIVIVHNVRYLVDVGVEKMWAASLFAAIGALSSGFRFFWGWISDRVGRQITFTLGSICLSSGIFFLLLVQVFPVHTFIYLFALFFAAGWGVTAPMFMSIAADFYQGKNFGLIYGIVEGMIGIGGASGAWVAGFIFDHSGSYLWAFVLSILLNFMSIFLVWHIEPRKTPPVIL
jgi:MFS family permease